MVYQYSQIQMKTTFFKNKSSQNIVLKVLCAFVLLTIIDFFIGKFAPLGFDEKKILVKTKEGWGNCYSSDRTHYLPLSLKNSPQQKELLKGRLADDVIEQIAHETPYCIFYDVPKRRRGYYPERKFQIALIGDSVAFGEGLKDEETLAFQLDSKYNEVNVRNFAKPNADFLEIYKIAFWILQNEKGIKDIVYILNLDDLEMPESEPNFKNSINDFQNIDWDKVPLKSSILLNFLRKSNLFRLLEKRFILRQEDLKTTKKYLDLYFKGENVEKTANFLTLLRFLNDLASLNHVSLHVIIYPIIYKDPLGRYPFKPIHNLLVAACQQYSISCIDAFPAFEPYYSLKKFRVQPIDYHPNGLAHTMTLDYLETSQKLKFATLNNN